MLLSSKCRLTTRSTRQRVEMTREWNATKIEADKAKGKWEIIGNRSWE